MQLSKWISHLCLLAGGILLGCSAYLNYDASSPQNAITGTVVGLINGDSQLPEVSYSINGRNYVYKREIRVSDRIYSVGESVALKYWSMTPEQATIDTSTNCLISLIMGGAGILTLLSGLLLPYKRQHHQTASSN
jgi:hypothetical protein